MFNLYEIIIIIIKTRESIGFEGLFINVYYTLFQINDPTTKVPLPEHSFEPEAVLFIKLNVYFIQDMFLEYSVNDISFIFLIRIQREGNIFYRFNLHEK